MIPLNDNRIVFKTLTTKLSSLFLNHSDGDRSFVRKTLDDLNKLNFRFPTVGTTTDAILLIRNICLHVSHDDTELIPKCCRLITQLINIQKIVLEQRIFNDLMNWSFKALCIPENQEYNTIEVLILLDTMVRSSNISLEHYIFTAIDPDSPIFKILEREDSPAIRRYCLQFLEACTIINEIEDDQTYEKLKKLMLKCSEIFQYNLLELKKLDDPSYLKIKIICFRGLENILRKFDDIVEIGHILGIIKYYMLLGIRNFECSEIKPLLPSTLSIPEPESNSVREKKGGKVTKLRKHKVSKQMETQPSEGWMKTPSLCAEDTRGLPVTQLVTSDSDLSDSAIPKAVNIPRLQSRVRQTSMSLLFAVAKKLQRSMLKYWTSFIPESTSSGKLYLTTCILEDPSMECRGAALNVLLFMISSAKLCLSQADSLDKSTAFTPFSAILGSMIVSLHECLNLALKDKITSVIAQVLKCYAALVEGTPYHRLNPGMVTEVVHNVLPLLHHKDPTVKTGAFIVLGCILASEPILEETVNLFRKIDLEENTNGEENINRLPIILRECLSNLMISNRNNVTELAPLPVKIEAIKVISCMCRNYFDRLIYPHLTYIGKAVCDCLSENSYDIKLHTGRTIEFIGQSMDQFLQETERSSEKEAPGVTFWLNLLNGPFPGILAAEEASLQAVACSCFGSIGSRIFENLPIDKHFLIVTFILSSSKGAEPILRSSAVRALGILSHYSFLREDTGFVLDVANVLYDTLNDEIHDVRLKSSWALGTFTDLLVLSSKDEHTQTEFPSVLVMKLLEKSVTVAKAGKNSDITKANLSKVMGNLLHLLKEEIFQNLLFRKIVQSAIDWLMNIASTIYSVKVRWNACYALSLLLKNDAIFVDEPKWLESIFLTLNNLVSDFKNFKVRTTAALALASPSKRSYYGTQYHNTFKSLLKSLEVSQNDVYFEIQQKNRLIEQVCLSIAHVISVSEIEDLSLMRESLNSYSEICKTQMKRMYEILLPEKSNIIVEAAEHLRTFNESNMNLDTREALNILKDIIVQDFI